MSIEFFDPVGEPQRTTAGAARKLESLGGRRAGYVFNQHVSALTFWEALEKAVAALHAPSHVQRIYKPAHSVTATRADLERLSAATDYALVGVGA